MKKEIPPQFVLSYSFHSQFRPNLGYSDTSSRDFMKYSDARKSSNWKQLPISVRVLIAECYKFPWGQIPASLSNGLPRGSRESTVNIAAIAALLSTIVLLVVFGKLNCNLALADLRNVLLVLCRSIGSRTSQYSAFQCTCSSGHIRAREI